MGKIATRNYCNTIVPGSFIDNLNKCPTKDEIVATNKLEVTGSYLNYQLVNETDIKELVKWEITFKFSSNSSFPNPYLTNAGVIFQYKLNSRSSNFITKTVGPSYASIISINETDIVYDLSPKSIFYIDSNYITHECQASIKYGNSAIFPSTGWNYYTYSQGNTEISVVFSLPG